MHASEAELKKTFPWGRRQGVSPYECVLSLCPGFLRPRRVFPRLSGEFSILRTVAKLGDR